MRAAGLLLLMLFAVPAPQARAADAVTIFNGKLVTISGPSAANVFTNRPNYSGSGGDGSTTGAFGGKGATTQPLANAPGF
jgi:hypothetical protein